MDILWFWSIWCYYCAYYYTHGISEVFWLQLCEPCSRHRKIHKHGIKNNLSRFIHSKYGLCSTTLVLPLHKPNHCHVRYTVQLSCALRKSLKSTLWQTSTIHKTLLFYKHVCNISGSCSSISVNASIIHIIHISWSTKDIQILWNHTYILLYHFQYGWWSACCRWCD